MERQGAGGGQHVPVDDGQPACRLQAADETIQDGASDW